MRLFLLTSLLLGYAMPAISGDIALSIKGSRLTWLSAIVSEGGLVPAVWDIPLHLPAAEKVVPGGPTNVTEQLVTLNGPGGSVEVPLTLIGMSYRLSSNNSTFPQGSAGVNTTVVGNSAVVEGAGIGNQIVTLTSLSSPFTHFRPILKTFDEKAWVEAFKVAYVQKGTYQGELSYQVPYNYYQNGVIVRNTLQASLTVQLEYNPAQLNSISVLGDQIISPIYYGYPTRMVGGKTDYTVTARGTFPNGVRIGLKSNMAHARYQLNPRSNSLLKGIPYNVKCIQGCDVKLGVDIIKDGNAVINSTDKLITMISNDNLTAQAKIRVSFSIKNLDDLITDTYEGNFILIFEAGI